MSEEQVSDGWREYFEKLLNEENEWNDELSAEYVEGPADMISKEEVRQAIQDLKVRKAAGPSGVTAEMIKAAGEQAVDWLTSICNRIVKEEAIPESWQMELWWAFVDLEKAFDRVPRKVVEWAMRKLGVEEWLVRAVMAMYKHAIGKVNPSTLGKTTSLK